MRSRTRPAAWAATLGVPVLILAGCGSLQPDAAAAGDTALAFTTAVNGGDGGTACSVLADETRSELEEMSGVSCGSAVLETGLSPGDEVVGVSVYGANAQVELNADVVFLSDFDGTWKVVAAGCEPVPGEPYDCSIHGS